MSSNRVRVNQTKETVELTCPKVECSGTITLLTNHGFADQFPGAYCQECDSRIDWRIVNAVRKKRLEQ